MCHKSFTGTFCEETFSYVWRKLKITALGKLQKFAAYLSKYLADAPFFLLHKLVKILRGSFSSWARNSLVAGLLESKFPPKSQFTCRLLQVFLQGSCPYFAAFIHKLFKTHCWEATSQHGAATIMLHGAFFNVPWIDPSMLSISLYVELCEVFFCFHWIVTSNWTLNLYYNQLHCTQVSSI